MIEELVVWMLAAYGCSSLLVTLLNRLADQAIVRAGEPHLHYEVLLYNSEHCLEGTVRRLMSRSVLQGRPIQISFVDFGSTDDTLKITTVFERKQHEFAGDGKPDTIAPPITIDLRRSKEQESRM
ncbi:glycosyltransferase family 2 protein [Brevibacillus sp. H7]|uniref:glycosyltransferase family 2 protein n=1 Tax=Brevibacillus sp. H7 TaxID=3349138 RepID=UPI00380564DC